MPKTKLNLNAQMVLASLSDRIPGQSWEDFCESVGSPTDCLVGADLQGEDFSGLDLSGANLTGANLRRLDFTSTNISEVDFTNAVMYHANLANADLHDGSLLGARLMGANLRGANLRGADLSGGWFSSADLTGADLRGANVSPQSDPFLDGTDFSYSILKGANLTGASVNWREIHRPDFTGADLRGAIVSLNPSDGVRPLDEAIAFAKLMLKEIEARVADGQDWLEADEFTNPDVWGWSESPYGVAEFVLEDGELKWLFDYEWGYRYGANNFDHIEEERRYDVESEYRFPDHAQRVLAILYPEIGAVLDSSDATIAALRELAEGRTTIVRE